MTSRKLSESDKQEMLQFYRQPGETTSTLASRYGVSNSTISRILKTSFSEAEYETLIQQKRGGRAATEIASPLALDFEPFAGTASEQLELESVSTSGSESAVEVANTTKSISANATEAIPLDATESFSAAAAADEPLPTSTANGRRLRKRSSAPSEPIASIAPPIVRAKMPERVDLLAIGDPDEAIANSDEPKMGSLDLADDDRATAAAELVVGEALLDDEADLTGDLEEDDLNDDALEDDDLDDDDLEDDDLDDDLENGALLVGSRIAGKVQVQVLPLASACLPRTCYLVVDRSAELIARPLKEFGDLGQIPEAEVLEKTLPVFDNHRIAKRYSNPRTQRVIKLPDGQVLQKTSSHLQAKGITRLLIDGQVYAL